MNFIKKLALKHYVKFYEELENEIKPICKHITCDVFYKKAGFFGEKRDKVRENG